MQEDNIIRLGGTKSKIDQSSHVLFISEKFNYQLIDSGHDLLNITQKLPKIEVNRNNNLEPKLYQVIQSLEILNIAFFIKLLIKTYV